MVTRRPDVATYLSSHPLFSGLPEPDVARVIEVARIVHLPRGAVLFEAGEQAEGLYLVIEGLVKVYASADKGQEKVLDVVGPGGCVADALMFDGDDPGLRACVLSDSQIVVLPKDWLMGEMVSNGKLALRIVHALSQRLHRLVKDIQAVTLHSGVRRVVDYLLHATPEHAGASASGGATVFLPASKGTIASLLSVTPEHFSRILHELQSNGLIEVDRRRIHIRNATALTRYG
jgi:CRP-like cAMP-binding protein